MTNIIIVGLLSALVTALPLSFYIVILKDKAEIQRLKDTISQQEKDLFDMNKLLDVNAEELTKENNKLMAQVHDLKQLRELDREASVRLNKENEILQKEKEKQEILEKERQDLIQKQLKEDLIFIFNQ